MCRSIRGFMDSIKTQHDELTEKGWKCKQNHYVGRRFLVPFETYDFECRQLELQWTTEITHSKKGSYRKWGWFQQSESTVYSFDRPEFRNDSANKL